MQAFPRWPKNGQDKCLAITQKRNARVAIVGKKMFLSLTNNNSKEKCKLAFTSSSSSAHIISITQKRNASLNKLVWYVPVKPNTATITQKRNARGRT